MLSFLLLLFLLIRSSRGHWRITFLIVAFRKTAMVRRGWSFFLEKTCLFSLRGAAETGQAPNKIEEEACFANHHPGVDIAVMAGV
jgi:hypothetical protein